MALREDLGCHIQHTPYDVYKELDLGPRGYAVALSTQVRRGVQDALKKKLKR